MRSDARRSVDNILGAGERVLSENPAATMDQIAAAAGVARTTLHRHFTNRDALVAAMARGAWERVWDAVEQARPATAPPMVALHQATANILRIKAGWSFALDQPPADPETARLQDQVYDACRTAFSRARDDGHIRADVDLDWARQVYLALISETAHHPTGTETDPDVLAARIIGTLLHGVAPR